MQKHVLAAQTIIHSFTDPQFDKLCYAKADEDVPSEEVVLAVQGVLVDVNLPPIQDKTSYVNTRPPSVQSTSSPSHIVYSVQKFIGSIGQRIMLTGFDLEAYQDIIKALANINQIFAEEAPDGQFQPIEVVQQEGNNCLRFANRYLTPKSQSANDKHVADSLSVIDPYGYLKKMAGTKFVHAEENVVQYFKKRQFIERSGET